MSVFANLSVCCFLSSVISGFIDMIVDLLFDKQEPEVKQNVLQEQEIHNAIKKKKQLKAGWLNLDFNSLGPNAPTTVDWGAFDIDLDRGCDILLNQFLIECVCHPLYHGGIKEKLTSIKLNGKRIVFDIGYHDDCRKTALVNGFGDKHVHQMICYLCANPENPTYGVGTINTVCHAKCFRQIHLLSKKSNVLFNVFMVRLPAAINDDANNIDNLMVTRNCLVNEILGKAFDAVTKQEYIKSRQAIFGKGTSENSTTFDWSVLRLVGKKSKKNWDQLTSDLCMLRIYIY